MSGGAAAAVVLSVLAGLAGSVQIAATIALLIAGQLAMGAVIDRFGLFGLERIALSWPRVLGIALLAVGAALSLRKN